jgi:type II secretory pathway pseudopilin PulG
MNIAKRREAGFTLLEIMVTAGLTAIVVGMGFSVMTSAQQTVQMQQEQSAVGRDGWSFVYKLSRELREAVPPSQLGEGAEWRGTSASAKLLDEVSTAGWPDATLKSKEFKALEASFSRDTIRFCTLRVASPKQQPAPGMIEYSLQRDEKKNVINIVRRSALAGVPLDKGEKEVIWPSDVASSLGFVSLGFQYLDAQGQWQKEWTDAKAMPRAVRVSVSTLVRPSRRIKVPVVNEYSTLVYLPTDSRIPQ